MDIHRKATLCPWELEARLCLRRSQCGRFPHHGTAVIRICWCLKLERDTENRLIFYVDAEFGGRAEQPMDPSHAKSRTDYVIILADWYDCKPSKRHCAVHSKSGMCRSQIECSRVGLHLRIVPGFGWNSWTSNRTHFETKSQVFEETLLLSNSQNWQTTSKERQSVTSQSHTKTDLFAP